MISGKKKNEAGGSKRGKIKGQDSWSVSIKCDWSGG